MRTIATFGLLLPCMLFGSATRAPKFREADYVQALQTELQRYPSIRPEMVAKLILVESRGHIEVADGAHGEIGAMQIRPQTFAYVERNILHKKQGSLNPRRHQDNLVVGVALLNWLLKRYNHNESLALIGYNAGIGTADRAKRKIARGEKPRIPPTTRAYLRTVLGTTRLARVPQRPLQLHRNTAPRTLVALANPLPLTIVERVHFASHQTLGPGPRQGGVRLHLYADRVEERIRAGLVL